MANTIVKVVSREYGVCERLSQSYGMKVVMCTEIADRKPVEMCGIPGSWDREMSSLSK